MHDFISFECESGITLITSYQKHKVFFPKEVILSSRLFCRLNAEFKLTTTVDSVGSKLSMEI